MGSSDGWLCLNAAFFAKTYPPHAAVPMKKTRNRMSTQREVDGDGGVTFMFAVEFTEPEFRVLATSAK